MVALTTRPLERLGSIPRLGSSAPQRARPSEFSLQQGGLWLHSYGLALAPALQTPPSPLSTLHSPGNSLCVYLRSHSTEAAPAGVEHPPERWEPPLATHRGAYPQIRCVCPKPWQRLHYKGPFGATYDSIDTRRPQSSVIECTLDSSGPRATETIKWGWEGDPLWGPANDGRNAAA